MFDRVVHQQKVVAQGGAQLSGQLDIALDTAVGMVLGAFVALLFCFYRIGDQFVDSGPANIAIGGDFVAAAAQEFVDGLFGVAAGQVPEHIIDLVDKAATSIEKALGVPQALPDVFAVKGIHADQHGGDIGFELFGFPLQVVLVEASAERGIGIQVAVGNQAQGGVVGRAGGVVFVLDNIFGALAAKAQGVGEHTR